jgi:hypothetical protein
MDRAGISSMLFGCGSSKRVRAEEPTLSTLIGTLDSHIPPWYLTGSYLAGITALSVPIDRLRPGFGGGKT